MILRSKEEIDFFSRVLKSLQLDRIESFDNAKDAYEVVIRKQFQLFITRMEVAPFSGIVLIQKIRETGNYGLETHLFVADKIDQDILNSLNNLDINYVLVKPFTYDRISQKMKHIFNTEKKISAVEIKYREAKSAFGNNLLDMAEEISVNLLKENSNYEKIYVLLGDIAFKRKDYAKANQYFDQALHLNPKDSVAFHRKAQIFMAENRYQEASDILNKLTSLDPYNIKLLENAGLSNYEIGNKEKASEIMTKLNTIDSGNVVANHTLAEIAADRGDFDQMLDIAASSLNAKDLVSFLNNKAVKLSKENPEQAIKLYEKSLKLLADNPYSYAIYYNIGLSYKKLGELQFAKTYLAKAIEAKPDFEKAVNSLKKIMSDLKKQEKKVG